jgi:hypothetical protein
VGRPRRNRREAAQPGLERISGEWDEPALAAILEELGSSAIDLTGFGSAEIDELIARMKREARQADPDDVPEPPVVPVSKPGDLRSLANPPEKKRAAR